MDEEDKALRAISGAVVKSVVVICFTVWACFWVNSCGVDATTIQECKAACSGSDSQMRAVTSRECECEQKSSNEWVIPRSSSRSSGSSLPLTPTR